MKTAGKTMLSIIVFMLFFNKTFAADTPMCRDGDYWVFDIKGGHAIAKMSYDAIGIFKINCLDGKPIMENEYGKDYFVSVIPSVPGLTEAPPWFKFLEGVGAWDWDFNFVAITSGKQYNSEKWSAHFVAKPLSEELTAITRRDTLKAGASMQKVDGWRKYEYLFSKKTRSTVKMSAEWKNGTTYQLELMEYKIGAPLKEELKPAPKQEPIASVR